MKKKTNNNSESSQDSSGRRPGSKKRCKTASLKIHPYEVAKYRQSEQVYSNRFSSPDQVKKLPLLQLKFLRKFNTLWV